MHHPKAFRSKLALKNFKIDQKPSQSPEKTHTQKNTATTAALKHNTANPKNKKQRHTPRAPRVNGGLIAKAS
jgi:hypothetical protein